MHHDMLDLLMEIEAALTDGSMKWECASHSAGTRLGLHHYTGRGPKWVVQLVTLDNGQRMAAATAGGTVMKLTDDLTEKAEEIAKIWLDAEAAK